MGVSESGIPTVLATMELGSKEFWDTLEASPERVVAAICQIEVAALVDAMQKHPSLRAWVNAAHERARLEEERAQFEVTKARANALLNARKTEDSVTKKAKVVEVLKAEVEVDQTVITATEALLDAQEKRGVLRALSSALEDRLQMLIQLSAREREEIRDYGRK